MPAQFQVKEKRDESNSRTTQSKWFTLRASLSARVIVDFGYVYVINPEYTSYRD